MTKIFKMDLHRILHSKIFYVSIAFMTIMAVALVMSGMSTDLNGLLGVSGETAGAAASRDDFMNSAMGTGVIYILVSIMLTLFVCGDYSGGFAKNIFAAHASPWDYIGGKMLSMAAASGFFMVFYTIESMLSLSIIGDGFTLPGGVIGLVFFLVQKWLLSCALSSMILLVVVFTRNIAWGVLAGFLIATGGLTMGITLFASAFNWDWITTVFSVTISGSAQLCTLSFRALTFLRILLASAAWTGIGCFLSRRTLLTKDI